ncbi:Oxoglutarate/iron-dependent dioxygenase [Artemisia annua]|uniref:Oxoglutarate/iron-dependent dioxygenase n=1 Tax=Artemisia annua TaxID=35608 RepID=A0A2U1LBT3_ARTAN|nr:Oxoglutarate/iron-dependent dioxygenase [Artemisia annua]
MYGSENLNDDSERTAFRKTEKKYKLYYDSNKKKKKLPRAVDLSDVIDFKAISESFDRNEELPVGVSKAQSRFDNPVFCLDACPGFYFIPAALSVEEQHKWIKESLVSFPQPPNRTNHNVVYGPIHSLFRAANDKQILVEEANDVEGDVCSHRWAPSEESDSSLNGNSCKSISASVLLRKLRWSTLGLQFDWSKRGYNVSLPHNKIPDALSQLAKKMAAPAMPVGEDFQPEAAIVNYFGPGDMLGGHLDDMEVDWSKPIVSMSLGCKAIFLLGGKSRNDEPLAMFLRSGDIVLMSGEARERFHGVPRIFTDAEHAEIGSLEKLLSDEDDICYLEYIKTSRININIRQVF